MAFHERLRAARKALRPKVTQSDVAEQLGVSTQAVSGWERGENMPEPERLPQIAQILNASLDDLLTDGDFTPASQELRPEATRRGRADFKVFGTVEGGAGSVILSSEPVETIEWPTILAGVPDAYGVLVVGDSMYPALRPGEIALVHPHLPPRTDEEVVLQREDHGVRYGIIKTFVRQTTSDYRLKQWNPAKEFYRSKKEWPICHSVVGKFRR